MNVYCQSCGSSLVDLHDGVCLDCGYASTGTQLVSTIPTLPKRKIPVRVEVGLAVDRTPSSEAFSDSILVMPAQILTGVSQKAAEVLCWLQTHGDLESGDLEILHTDGGDPKQVVENLLTIEFAGGGRPRETHLDALCRLANLIPFTSNPRVARGVIIGFMTDDSKSLRDGRKPELLGEEFVKRGLLTYLVCEPRDRLMRFADAAQAMVIPITKNPDQAMVKDIVAKVSASIAATLATGGTVPLDIDSENVPDFAKSDKA